MGEPAPCMAVCLEKTGVKSVSFGFLHDAGAAREREKCVDAVSFSCYT